MVSKSSKKRHSMILNTASATPPSWEAVEINEIDKNCLKFE